MPFYGLQHQGIFRNEPDRGFEGNRRADAGHPGDDDQIVPIKASALPASRITNNAQLIAYEGGSHGICTTEKNRVCADLQVFIRG